MNPILNFLIAGGVIVLSVAFFGVVLWISYRVLRHGERYFGEPGELPGGPTPQRPPSRPPDRSKARRGRQR